MFAQCFEYSPSLSDSSRSISIDRRLFSGSFRNWSISSGVAMRPMMSRVARRTNSWSSVKREGTTFSVFHVSSSFSLMNLTVSAIWTAWVSSLPTMARLSGLGHGGGGNSTLGAGAGTSFLSGAGASLAGASLAGVSAVRDGVAVSSKPPTSRAPTARDAARPGRQPRRNLWTIVGPP